MCQVPENQLRLNRDRGTALICDDKLIGILSVIIPANYSNSTNDFCSNTLQTNAYYTIVPLYLNWIHGIIGTKTPSQSYDGKPIPILPAAPSYQSSTFIIRIKL